MIKLGLECVQLLLVVVRLARSLLELVTLRRERVHTLGMLLDDLVNLLVLDAHCLEHPACECQLLSPVLRSG